MENKKQIQPLWIIIYYFAAGIFLFLAGSAGSYLMESEILPREIVLIIQGLVFTGLMFLFMYFIRRRDPDIFRRIGLKKPRSMKRLVIAIAIPFLLILTGVVTASLFGFIDNMTLNITVSVITAVLLNIIAAFLYEALPEEIFLRGLIFEQFNRKYRFMIATLFQTLIFVLVPILVFSLNTLFLGQPFAVTPDYVILILTFGIVLQLAKEYTGSLWMSIIFHLIYLETARFISGAGAYAEGNGLIRYDEVFPGVLTLYLSFLFVIIFSLIIYSILTYRNKKRK